MMAVGADIRGILLQPCHVSHQGLMFHKHTVSLGWVWGHLD